MLKLLDRYIIKEIFSPFLIGLLVYTFVLLMNEILVSAELFIIQNVPLKIVLNLLLYLIPSILAFTVPMSVLMGILAGMSRMSSDLEIVALRSGGVSLSRLLRPVLIFSFACFIITSYLTLWASPHYNHKFVKTFTKAILTKTKLQIKPREFYDSIPNLVIYIQDIFPSGEWKNIFVNFSNSPENPRIVFAQEGNLEINREKKRAILHLKNGVAHSYNVKEPEKYSLTSFSDFQEEIDIQKTLISPDIKKRVREKDINELFASIRKLTPNTSLYNSHLIEIHKKFALPFACLIFAFLGLPLGIYTKKGGRTTGFTISLFIILIYYILITAGENLAHREKISPFLGMWGANILIVIFGGMLFYFSIKEKPFKIKSPFSKKSEKTIASSKSLTLGISLKMPFYLRFPNTIDRYILRKYLKIATLVFFSLLFIFIIITFFERIDNIYEHKKPLWYLFEYIWYFLPKMIYLVLPVTALTSVLLTFGLLTKTNELIAMKACGQSIYRLIVPIIIISLIFSFFSFYLQEKVLPYSNIKAEEIWNKINDVPPRTHRYLNRQWVFGKRNKIYHYLFFDPERKEFNKLSIIEFNPQNWNITKRIYAEKGILNNGILTLKKGWIRAFPETEKTEFKKFKEILINSEEKSKYFTKEWKAPDQMNFSELKKYINELERSGFKTIKFKVDLLYKISFPLVILVITIFAIPFSFSMGKKGALYGIGLSIAVSVIYWAIIGIFKSLGYVGYLPPFLAAWGPNLIFGSGGIYFLFSLRT